MAKRFPARSQTPICERPRKIITMPCAKSSQEFPDDLDAATLFAESGMNLHPWGLWHMDGTPEAGTEEIVATLESVMKRDPNHLGAIHYYIHAVEASPRRNALSRRREPAGRTGSRRGTYRAYAAHVYIRTGDYEAAVKTNEEAATPIAPTSRPAARRASTP